MLTVAARSGAARSGAARSGAGRTARRPGRGLPGTGPAVAGPAGHGAAHPGSRGEPGGNRTVRGHSHLLQRAAGRTWRVSATGFWQVHPAAADTLARAVLDALRPQPGDTALDLYCGAGLFTGGLVAAAVGPAGTVIGVESGSAAVRDARRNLREEHRGPACTRATPAR